LKESGKTQAFIFLHLALNTFEQIESYLGMPREFRLHDYAIMREGLLSAEDLKVVLESTIRREESAQFRGKSGGIKTLRDTIWLVKQLLENRIVP
jgi:hypothetical protein